MLVATQLERVFVFKDKTGEVILTDPNPKWSKEAVLNFYASTYPILTTAKISGPQIQKDQVQYCFDSAIGTKG